MRGEVTGTLKRLSGSDRRMTRMKKHLSRFLADYGMSVVLLLLCVLFTFATISDQQPTGERAAAVVANDLRLKSHVLIVGGAGRTPGDLRRCSTPT